MRFSDDIAEMVEENIKIVNATIRKYFKEFIQWPCELKDRAVSVGMWALARAVRGYRPDRGSFSTLAYFAVRRAIGAEIGMFEKKRS